jgi:hypothetical protein
VSQSSFRALAIKGWRGVWFAAIATTAIGTAAAVDVPITVFQGPWVAGVTYAPGAIVTYEGASYISILQSTHFAPATHAAYWKVLDAAGAMGPAGPPGPQGPPGPTGPSGTQGLFGSNPLSSEDNGVTGAPCTVGSLMLTLAVVYPSGNYLPANGGLVLISANTQALFDILGTTYGGDGVYYFGLPDLRPVAPNQTAYLICYTGVYP